MALTTVLIPTFDHGDLLVRAIHSVKEQTVQDFEIFVVGDGASQRTAELMDHVCKRDSRIRFFPNPKGPRTGELYRHAALQEASGRFVCYLGDDDLWLPDHLSIITNQLQDCDFCHTIQVDIRCDGKISVFPCDLSNAQARNMMLNSRFNMFGLSVTGHTMDFYRRLPYGWRTAPDTIWTDLHMWRQFLLMPDCRYQTVFEPTVLKFPAKARSDMSLAMRGAELDGWLERIKDAGFAAWWKTAVWETVCSQLLQRHVRVKNLETQLGISTDSPPKQLD